MCIYEIRGLQKFIRTKYEIERKTYILAYVANIISRKKILKIKSCLLVVGSSLSPKSVTNFKKLNVR